MWGLHSSWALWASWEQKMGSILKSCFRDSWNCLCSVRFASTHCLDCLSKWPSHSSLPDKTSPEPHVHRRFFAFLTPVPLVIVLDKHQVILFHADWIEERGLEVWHLMFIASFSQEKESVLISFHVTSVQTCRWNAKYPGSWELLGIDSHWSLLFWFLTCGVKIGWCSLYCRRHWSVFFINCVSGGLLQRDDEVICVPCAKGRCQSPGH